MALHRKIRASLGAGAVAAAIASVALVVTPSAPVLAVVNPIVAQIHPVGANGARGRVSFFQLGNDVVVNVVLQHGRKGTQSVGIHEGTCARYRPRANWVVVGVEGSTQSTRVPHLKLKQLLGHALVIHKTRDRSSAAIGCADIRDAN